MLSFIIAVDTTVLGVQAIIGLGYLVSSIWEKEMRAALFAVFQFVGMLGLFLAFVLIAGTGFFHTVAGGVLLVLGTLTGVATVGFFTRRTPPNNKALLGAKGLIVEQVERFDERCTVFARNKLKQGSKEYTEFYKAIPDLEENDKKRRQMGGVLGKFGRIDMPNERPNVAAILSNRSIPHVLASPEIVNPLPTPWYGGNKAEFTPEEATLRVKGYVRYLGADMVGITEINPLWTYSHRGQVWASRWETTDFDWSQYGKQISVEHKYAIVIAEEMEREMIDTSPHTPGNIESMKNYAKGAVITSQLAAYIANLGYSATANHVQHYTAILPALAVDAGMGELSRMGYLLTKEFGPRIRLSAVTTDLPLVADKPVDIGAHHFCQICKKCANCCPSDSIPRDDEPTPVNGTLRWKLNAETCFAYWAKAGTDCCVCMKVCPWSHARTWPHRIIVWLISRNKYSRVLFNLMDDIFYGRKPKPKTGPAWAAYQK